MKQVVNILDARERIQQLMQERNWTIYRLAKESGLSQTTISNIFKRNNEPSIPTLKRLCGAFGITMSQFFRGSGDYGDYAVSEEQQELIKDWTIRSVSCFPGLSKQCYSTYPHSLSARFVQSCPIVKLGGFCAFIRHF